MGNKKKRQTHLRNAQKWEKNRKEKHERAEREHRVEKGAFFHVVCEEYRGYWEEDEKAHWNVVFEQWRGLVRVRLLFRHEHGLVEIGRLGHASRTRFGEIVVNARLVQRACARCHCRLSIGNRSRIARWIHSQTFSQRVAFEMFVLGAIMRFELQRERIPFGISSQTIQSSKRKPRLRSEKQFISIRRMVLLWYAFGIERAFQWGQAVFKQWGNDVCLIVMKIMSLAWQWLLAIAVLFEPNF